MKNKLLILGASNAIPASGNLYSQMALLYDDRCAVIDCGNNPINPLLDRGVALDKIEHLIITHFHPDHVAALPNFLTEMKIRGRSAPLTIHANEFATQRVIELNELFGLKFVPGKYSINYHVVDEVHDALVFENELLRVSATPMKHFIPTLGLAFQSVLSDHSIAYTCDTEPHPGVDQLAAGKNALIHECTGAGAGHSSAEEAAVAAAKAEVDELILIHYPSDVPGEELVARAGKVFEGKITLAKISMERDIDQ